MAGYENTSGYEQSGFHEYEPPRSHMEGIAASQLEGMTDSQKNLFVGERFYTEEVATSPGLLEGFQEITGQDTKEAFAAYYERYIDDPHGFQKASPEIYDFFKDRVFYGREYGLSGMEAFMNRTAPERVREAAEEKPLEEIARLPRTEILDAHITNCTDPFSYGNAQKMAMELDHHKGDTGLLPIAPDRMVACRNLMALCGKEDFTEGEVTAHAVDHEYMAYDPLWLKGFSHDLNHMIMPDIIRGMSGIETHGMNITEMENPAEMLADQLDQGYRGIVVYHSGILNNAGQEITSPRGKLAEFFSHCSANEAATLECAVRDGKTGEVKGFYICDSTAGEPTRYVEADRLMNALNVKNGTLLLTDNAYLDK